VKRYFFLLISFLIPWVTWSQVVIDGTVWDKEGKSPLQDVAIKASYEGNRQIATFTFTDNGGHYKLAFPESKTGSNVTIHYSILGFTSAEITVPLQAATINQSLSHEEFALKEVTVKAPSISSSGDTINYNVTSFLSPSDRNIEDVLKKLPGINVQSNGNLEYMGRPINKFYIEGLDMLGGNYNMITQNISPDQIASIQVYENHQPVRLLKGIDFTDQAGLNLTLKNKRMTRPVGYLTLGAGYDESDLLHEAGLFGFMANSKTQYLSTLKTNNAGEKLSDNLNGYANTSLSHVKIGTIIKALPFNVPTIVNDRKPKASSDMGSVNIIRKLKEETQLRLNLTYHHDEDNYFKSAVNTYSLPDSVRTIYEDIETEQVIKALDAHAVLERNSDNRYLKNDFTCDVNASSSQSDIFNQRHWQQDYKLREILFRNNLSVIWKNKDCTYNIQSVVSGGFVPNNKLNIMNDDMPQYARQKNTGENFSTVTSTSFLRGLNASSTVSLGLRLTTDYDALHTTLAQEDAKDGFINYNRGYKVAINAIPAYSYSDGTFSFRFELPIQAMTLSYKDKIKQNTFSENKTLLNARVQGRYALTPMFSVNMSFNSIHNMGDLMSFIMQPIRTSYNQLLYGNTGILAHNLSQTLLMGYDFRNTMQGLFSTLSFSYNRTKRNLLNGQNISDSANFTTLSRNKKNYSQSYNASFYMGRNFQDLKTTFAVTALYTHIQNESLRQDHSLKVVNEIFSISPSVNIRTIEWMAFSLKGTLFHDSQSICYTSPINKEGLFRWTAQANLTFMLPSNAEFYTTYEYYNTPSQYQYNKTCQFMNAGLRYLVNKKLEIEMKIQNLLNAKSYSSIVFTDSDILSTSYSLRPRIFMLCLKYVL